MDPVETHHGEDIMTVPSRVQIVGRIPAVLRRRVRAAAKRRKLSLNAFLINALAHAVSRPQSSNPKGA